MESTERKFILMFIMGAIALEVMTLCVRNWMEGYYGDVLVVTLCPWRLCNLNCFQCVSNKPTIGCFWMNDWGGTGFETFSIVSHLEYWSLGFLVVALMVSVLDAVHSFIKQWIGCSTECGKPLLVILIIASLLSTLSVSLFGATLHHPTSEISTFEDINLKFGWPFFARIVSAAFAWGASVAAICNQCTSTKQNLVPHDETIMVISAEREFDEDSLDEAENGVLL